MFDQPLDDSVFAAVVSLSGINSGLTRDKAVLQGTIAKLSVHELYHHDLHACPSIEYFQADQIENKRNQEALQLAQADFVACAHLQGQPPNMVETVVRSTAAQSLMNGEHDVSATLAEAREYIRKMGSLPGQRTLILISPGFLTLTPSAVAEKSQLLDMAAQSNVIINALDARGLYTTGIDASERGGNSELELVTGLHAEYRAETMRLDEDVMAEFAEGTGGTYFHNNNDLDAGLRSLMQTPEVVYLLEFSPDTVKPDGTYHRLTVKVDRKGVKLQARRGYFAPMTEKGAVANTAKSETVAPQTPNAAPADAPPKNEATTPPPAPMEASAAAPVPAPPPAKESAKKSEEKYLFWDPPDVDAPLRSVSSADPCPLSNVLMQSALRANDLISNLQNFTADEKIDYQVLGNMGQHIANGNDSFDYTVDFKESPKGMAIEENRIPEHGGRPLPGAIQDIGLPALALIFLPQLQADYEMKCEGAAVWNGQPTWVVHFQQRGDTQGHTASFTHKKIAYPAKLKGRAWIAQESSGDSGEILHLETSLMEPVLAADVRQMYLSIDYAPVQFRTQNERIWLPQSVDAYGYFGDHRTIVFHTFQNFLLFSIETDQKVATPKNP